MIPLLYFFLGMLFIQAIAPIINDLITLFSAFIESKVAQINERINDSNLRMREKQDQTKQIVGFAPEKITEEEIE